MSRAVLVLDSEFQRRKATDWCWAAKPGSRVEFKGPKRSLDQNSLMWALLTDIAVHMRKASGLEYSTEDWKHVFLHGWGREVRFLPALDGKGVVPVPQSSSDLSREEMTDFIEYILKEGTERGVTFHNPSEPSSAPTPADDAATEVIPSTYVADPSSSQESGEAGGTSGDEPETPPATSSRADCIKAFLTTATDAALQLGERRDLLEQMKDWWKEARADDLDFVRACLTTADKVTKGELVEKAARGYLESLP